MSSPDAVQGGGNEFTCYFALRTTRSSFLLPTHYTPPLVGYTEQISPRLAAIQREMRLSRNHPQT